MLERASLAIRGSIVSYLFSRKGSRGTFIFLHGWRSEASVWEGAMEEVSKQGFAVYAIDLPGFGKSENPPTAFTVGDYGDVVASFMEKLAITRGIIVGHSFGGRVGIVLSVEHASLVHKLVLVDAAGVREPSPHRTAMALVAKLLKPFFSPGFMQPARRFLYSFIGAEDYLETPLLKETFQKVISQDLSAFFPKISQETLLFWGEKDTDTPLSFAHAMEKSIPHVSLRIIPQAGHFSFLDAPDKFVSALISFA